MIWTVDLSTGYLIIIIIIITGFYKALFQLWSKRFTVYYYPGHRIQNQFCTQSALSPLPGEHSGQSPFYRRAQCQLNHNTVRILLGPHLTPGSRAAMWIKCLAEGQKYRATVGFEPVLSAWESSGHTTVPRHLHIYLPKLSAVTTAFVSRMTLMIDLSREVAINREFSIAVNKQQWTQWR